MLIACQSQAQAPKQASVAVGGRDEINRVFRFRPGSLESIDWDDSPDAFGSSWIVDQGVAVCLEADHHHQVAGAPFIKAFQPVVGNRGDDWNVCAQARFEGFQVFEPRDTRSHAWERSRKRRVE